jgi:hypothetical protein
MSLAFIASSPAGDFRLSNVNPRTNLFALAAPTFATAALNIVYHEKEKRGYIKLSSVALGLTLAFVLLGVVSIGLIVAPAPNPACLRGRETPPRP